MMDRNCVPASGSKLVFTNPWKIMKEMMKSKELNI